MARWDSLTSVVAKAQHEPEKGRYELRCWVSVEYARRQCQRALKKKKKNTEAKHKI